MRFNNIKIDELKPGDLFIWYFDEEDATADQMLMVATRASITHRAEQRTKLPTQNVWVLVEDRRIVQSAKKESSDRG